MLAGDDNNAEQTCGAFATALDAAKAHDTEALRVYGPAAEAMLNFPMANYPDVSLPPSARIFTVNVPGCAVVSCLLSHCTYRVVPGHRASFNAK